MVSIVDIMHGIQEQASFASSIKANAIHGVMPLSIILVQPVDVICPSLEPMVFIANKEHLTRKEV
jgi:hypothetical protein